MTDPGVIDGWTVCDRVLTEDIITYRQWMAYKLDDFFSRLREVIHR